MLHLLCFPWTWRYENFDLHAEVMATRPNGLAPFPVEDDDSIVWLDQYIARAEIVMCEDSPVALVGVDFLFIFLIRLLVCFGVWFDLRRGGRFAVKNTDDARVESIFIFVGAVFVVRVDIPLELPSAARRPVLLKLSLVIQVAVQLVNDFIAVCVGYFWPEL
jgi:hypothetical protein